MQDAWLPSDTCFPLATDFAMYRVLGQQSGSAAG